MRLDQGRSRAVPTTELDLYCHGHNELRTNTSSGVNMMLAAFSSLLLSASCADTVGTYHVEGPACDEQLALLVTGRTFPDQDIFFSDENSMINVSRVPYPVDHLGGFSGDLIKFMCPGDVSMAELYVTESSIDNPDGQTYLPDLFLTFGIVNGVKGELSVRVEIDPCMTPFGLATCTVCLEHSLGRNYQYITLPHGYADMTYYAQGPDEDCPEFSYTLNWPEELGL